jgi:hypothetical protein
MVDIKQKSVVYKVPEDVKQDYLQHGGPVLDKWILKNVRCPSCNGAIKTSACDTEGGTQHNVMLVGQSSQKTSEYYNRCVVRCGSCNKQFVFTYSCYEYPNSPNSLESEGEFKWDSMRTFYLIAFIIILAFFLGFVALFYIRFFMH